MYSSRSLPRPRGTTVAVAAAISTAVAVGIVALVTDLFQSRGEPLGQLAAAERACAAKVYVSEREACMRDWIAAAKGTRMAGR